MTQREEVRFKVYTKSSTLVRHRDLFPLDRIDFIKGDGTYDTTTYTYNVQNAGTYLLGFSCNKQSYDFNSAYEVYLNRTVDGASTSRVINRVFLTYQGQDSTLSSCFMYKLQVDDEVYIREWWGRSLPNLNSYTSDDTLNSFWGIRLDY